MTSVHAARCFQVSLPWQHHPSSSWKERVWDTLQRACPLPGGRVLPAGLLEALGSFCHAEPSPGSSSPAWQLGRLHRVPPSPQEMLALGCSNFFGSFFKIHVICCALSVTLAVDGAGGKSQVGSLPCVTHFEHKPWQSCTLPA